MNKFITILLLLALLVVCLCACHVPNDDKEENTVTYTDDLGRSVSVPESISRVVPTGTMAQMLLYTACPDKLVANAVSYSSDMEQYILPYNYNLPVVGQYYGNNANFSLEMVLSLNADVIIDVGETKDGSVENLDKLQQQLGMPVVFIANTLQTTAETYSSISSLLDVNVDKLTSYTEDALTYAKTRRALISSQVDVYIAMGNDGLYSNGANSMHSEIIDMVGGNNVADIGVSSSGMGSKVSMEQVLGWNPQVIIADGQNAYDAITSGEAWKNIDAVKNNRVHLIPSVPYSYVNRPPCVNRLIGIYWLGNVLYKHLYPMDISEEVINFNELFYHINNS